MRWRTGTILALMLALGLAGRGEAAARCTAHVAAAGADRIAYRSCGQGAPVLIVPGGPGLDADYIAPLADMVARLGRRAVLIEPRGTGRSRAALGYGSGLTVAGSVADVEAVRRAIGADRVALIGHSFGGGVVQAYAAAHPDRVARLVLLDSVGPDMAPAATPLDNWRARLSATELAAYDAARARGDRRAAMRIKFLGSFVHRDRGQRFVAALRDEAMHLDIAPLSDDYQRHFAVRGSALRAPVMIVTGAQDWIRGHEPALRRTYPAARLIEIDAAGHFPWADAPAATERALRQALNALALLPQ